MEPETLYAWSESALYIQDILWVDAWFSICVLSKELTTVPVGIVETHSVDPGIREKLAKCGTNHNPAVNLHLNPHCQSCYGREKDVGGIWENDLLCLANLYKWIKLKIKPTSTTCLFYNLITFEIYSTQLGNRHESVSLHTELTIQCK